MENEHNISIDKGALNKAKISEGAFDIKINDDIQEVVLEAKNATDDMLFKIDINIMPDKKCNFHFVIDMENARSVAEMLQLLNLYKGFLKRKIKINGVDLFGDILKGEVEFEIDDNLEVADIDDVIKYWNRVHELEQKLQVEFLLKMPLSSEDTKTLEELCKSFVDDIPFKINDINSFEFVTNDDSNMKKQEGKINTFSFILQSAMKNFLNIDLSYMYCIIYMRQIKISKVRVEKKLDNDSKKVKIYLGKGEADSFFAMKHFMSKESAQNYLLNHINEFQQAKSLW